MGARSEARAASSPTTRGAGAASICCLAADPHESQPPGSRARVQKQWGREGGEGITGAKLGRRGQRGGHVGRLAWRGLLRMSTGSCQAKGPRVRGKCVCVTRSPVTAPRPPRCYAWLASLWAAQGSMCLWHVVFEGCSVTIWPAGSDIA